MTNKHIELVKKWLADKNSVSLEELEAARDVTYAARAAAEAAYAAAARDADEAAGRAADVACWIERYEELTNEK